MADCQCNLVQSSLISDHFLYSISSFHVPVSLQFNAAHPSPSL